MNGGEVLLIFPGLALLFGARMIWRQQRYHAALARSELYRLPTMDDVLDRGLVGVYKHDAAAQRLADAAVSSGTDVALQQLKREYKTALPDAFIALPGTFLTAVAVVVIFPRVSAAVDLDVDAAALLWAASALVVGVIGLVSAIRWARRGQIALALAFTLGVVALAVAYGWIVWGH